MAKKGQEKKETKVLFGKMSGSLSMGIVGLANVGKSTFFNVLTNSQVSAENYPFCTIDPTTARAQVPDERWEHLCEVYKPQRRIPAFLSVTDIAGLIKGASEGLGLGNNFLSNISQVDGIYHMVRIFEDEEITHVEGGVDPVRDIEIVTNELRLKDTEKLTKQQESIRRQVERANDKQKKFEFDVMQKCLDYLKEGHDVRFGTYDAHEIEFINTLSLLTTKPVVFLINMNKEAFVKKRGKFLGNIKGWVDKNTPGAVMIPFSAELEKELATMEPGEKETFLKTNGIASALHKIILNGYSTLNLIHFFTAGEDEVKCWTIRQGYKAPKAAGVIHTDFEKGFICAEVMAYSDFKEHGNEALTKAAGKYMTKGKEYEVIDGDIILYKFNAASGGKKK